MRKRHFSFILLLLSLVGTVHATPSQSEVFKSIQESVSRSSDDSSGSAVPWICAGVAVVLVLALISRRQTLQAAPKPLNSPGRLLKEVMKSVPLNPRELKQVKLVAEGTKVGDDQPVTSPLVLLLCPSIIAKAAEDRSTRADRRTLVQVLKKLGMK